MLGSIINLILNLFVLIVNIVLILLGWLPRILAFLRDLAQWILAISAELYRAILNRLAPLARRLGINLVINPWRAVACVLLSLVFGLIIMVLAGWKVTPPGIGICAVHGLIVGITWDQLGRPSGIRLGV